MRTKVVEEGGHAQALARHFGDGVCTWVVALVSALTFSPSFKNCHAAVDQNNAKGEQQSAIPVGAWHVVQCEAVSLNENNGAVTAVATLAIESNIDGRFVPVDDPDCEARRCNVGATDGCCRCRGGGPSSYCRGDRET